MAKRQKLSLQQKRRVADAQQRKTQQKKAQRKKEVPASNIDESQLGEPMQGIVISRYGEQADVTPVESGSSEPAIYRVYLRQNLGSCVSGDRITFRLDQQSSGVIEAIYPRTSELTRPTPHAGVKTIVANVDQIFVVVACFPDYSSLILDRYLVACELAGITTHIVLNKTDLLDAEQLDYFEQQLAIYQSIGYQTFKVSAEQPDSLKQLLDTMSGKENILVGQSGVGKSSLINQLLPNALAVTGEVSQNSRLGTHTTTASRLYFLPQSGCIIDSPGVREFGLSHIDEDELINGFIDLHPFLGQCKFRNCRHLNEKGCAVLEAANNQKISPQRWDNYQKIYQQISAA